MQNWHKIGLIKIPADPLGNSTHYTVPFATPLNEEIIRIYFSPRDQNNCSYITYADYNIVTNTVINSDYRHLLSKGAMGTFDDAGVVLFQILNAGKKDYLYYSGWMLGVTVPFYFWIGLAIADENGEFIKYSEAPIMPVSDEDPLLTGAPYVLFDEGIWKMWYISGTKWVTENNHPKHYYTLKYAESSDGINWKRSKHICLPYKDAFEYAIARPCVIKENGIYRMWYSYRGTSKVSTYRIGYAESNDGLNWLRMDDEINLDVSEKGWDDQMICYSHIFRHGENTYMLYNGNDYGKTGIGLAILKK